MVEIRAIRADITSLEVDAIVNAANERLRGGGGVDGAIHRAAGFGLLEACMKFDGCPTGEVRVTPGFKLPARYVIHAVGPVWQGGDAGEPEVLASCYSSAIAEAQALGLRSIAFSAISTGVYGYPAELAAAAAVAAIRAALAPKLSHFARQDPVAGQEPVAGQDPSSLTDVYLVAFTEDDLVTLLAALV